MPRSYRCILPQLNTPAFSSILYMILVIPSFGIVSVLWIFTFWRIFNRHHNHFTIIRLHPLFHQLSCYMRQSKEHYSEVGRRKVKNGNHLHNSMTNINITTELTTSKLRRLAITWYPMKYSRFCWCEISANPFNRSGQMLNVFYPYS